MRAHSLFLVALCLLSACLTAKADDVYNNGAINGTIDAWSINFGFIQSNSFTVSNGNGQVTGFAFGAWLFPGDVLTSAEVSFTAFELGGTTYFDQVLQFTQSDCVTNSFNYVVCRETAVFNGPDLADGNYWVNIQNATVASGDPVYWDENEGQSFASSSDLGTMPSESFTVLGSGSGTGTTAEPSAIMLLGTGVLGTALALKRKLL